MQPTTTNRYKADAIRAGLHEQLPLPHETWALAHEAWALAHEESDGRV
jgi:hypothetical protein